MMAVNKAGFYRAPDPVPLAKDELPTACAFPGAA